MALTNARINFRNEQFGIDPLLNRAPSREPEDDEDLPLPPEWLTVEH